MGIEKVLEAAVIEPLTDDDVQTFRATERSTVSVSGV
jgi:hypothetical protein